MHTVSQLQDLFVSGLEQRTRPAEPAGLYEPIDYIMSLGGKRIRPVMAMMSCELFGGRPADAMASALAVETFHNFTLLHDDIMDEAPLRRGRETVHMRYGVSQGILSGDLMLIMSYKYLMPFPDFEIRIPEKSDKYTKFIENIVPRMIANRALYEIRFQNIAEAKRLVNLIRERYSYFRLTEPLNKLR